jgi:hypothetical protein
MRPTHRRQRLCFLFSSTSEVHLFPARPQNVDRAPDPSQGPASLISIIFPQFILTGRKIITIRETKPTNQLPNSTANQTSNSITHSLPEKLTVTQLHKTLHVCSSPCSGDPATCFYPQKEWHIRTLPSYCFKRNFNINFPSTIRCSKWSLFLKFPYQNPECISLLFRTFYTHDASHRPWFIRWTVFGEQCRSCNFLQCDCLQSFVTQYYESELNVKFCTLFLLKDGNMETWHNYLPTESVGVQNKHENSRLKWWQMKNAE